MYLLNRLFRSSESGLTLILALMILAGVSLTVIPLLLLGSTSLLATNRAEQRFGERHAADAGVEDALWRIKWGDDFDSTIPYTNTLDFNGHSTTQLIEPAPLPQPLFPDPVPTAEFILQSDLAINQQL